MSASASIRRLGQRIKCGGLSWLLMAAQNRIWPAKPILASAILPATQAQIGLEIGGPSRVFGRRQILPVYPDAARIDNVNFTSQTAWETGLSDGGEFRFDTSKPAGRQYLREATDLTGIADTTYDFVLSSHCLEHTANPLAALREWGRVTRPGGHLVLLLPDPSGTFDHHRPITTLDHLKADFAAQTGETDLTHLDEILLHHDLSRDPPAGSAEHFKNRALLNFENRCLHHHVFDAALMRAVLEEAGWTVVGAETVRPIHLLALARKPMSHKEP